MRNREMIILGTLVLSALLLAACNGTTAPQPGTAPDQSVEDGVVAPESEPVEDEAAEEQAQPVGVDEPEVRQPRDELAATDPSTVVLAAGQPQLVEFFAFW